MKRKLDLIENIRIQYFVFHKKYSKKFILNHVKLAEQFKEPVDD